MLFTKKLPAGSGGDGDLVHTATNLPDGLTFDQGTQTVTGTPTTVEAPTRERYTVRDEDQDEASTTFTIEVSVNNTPTLDNLSTTTYPARVGVLFTKKLPAGSGGDGDLVHTATNLPDGSHFRPGERSTVTGTPTTVEAPTVTYTVRDEDQRRGQHDLYDRGQLPNNDADVRITCRPGYLPGESRSAPFTKVAAGGEWVAMETLVLYGDESAGRAHFRPGERSTVTGTPTTVEAPTVTYTVRDEDQDEAGTTFTIEVSVNNTPTLDNLSTTTYPARVGVLIHQRAAGGEWGRWRPGRIRRRICRTGSLSTRERRR